MVAKREARYMYCGDMRFNTGFPLATPIEAPYFKEKK
jgi:hypothetical protein